MESYKFYIDKEDLDGIDYNTNELFWLFCLLYEYEKDGMIRGNKETTCVNVSPQHLYCNIYNVVEISEQQRRTLMKSFKSLFTKGILTLVKGSIGWNRQIVVDIKNIIHQAENSFIPLDTDEVGLMLNRNPMEIATLMAIYLNIISYINQADVVYIDDNGVDYNIDVIGIKNKEQLRLSCWASQDRLACTKHSTDNNWERWISSNTLRKYIGILVELNLLAVVKPDVEGNTVNDYCYPRHANVVQVLSTRREMQRKYQQEVDKK